jgi:predicted NBD/HSP70 family sugar kinase
MKPQKTHAAEGSATDARRAVGRPRTIEAAQASLALLLNLIRTGAATTRQELERQSELGRAVVTDRLNMLTELGLVEEGELGQTTGGRAPRHMQFRANAGAVLVAMLDQTSMAVGVSDLGGRLLVEHHEAADLSAGPQPILARLVTLFKWMLEEHVEGGAVWGIGLALPGPVEKPADEAFATPVLRALQGWQDFPFLEELMIRLGAPVWARSGTQTMTMGEFKSGSGIGVSDLLFVKLGRTISAGVISEGRLHRGAQGAAGIIGNAWTGEDILDAVAGSDALEAEALAAAQDGRSRYLAEVLARQSSVTVSDAGHGAQLGDAFCVELLGRAGRLIGEALAPLANLLNPSLIVLGGSVAQTGDILLAAIREAVYRQSHPLVTRDLRIVRSQMGGSAGLVGAAQVVTEELFSSQTLQGWIALGSPREHSDFKAFLRRAETELHKGPPKPKPPGTRPAGSKEK